MPSWLQIQTVPQLDQVVGRHRPHQLIEKILPYLLRKHMKDVVNRKLQRNLAGSAALPQPIGNYLHYRPIGKGLECLESEQIEYCYSSDAEILELAMVVRFRGG